MVIFDEIHHAGDKSAWGPALLEAFGGEHVLKRLCLSGTPFMHNGQLIPFLSVNADQTYRVHFAYDYPRAIRDDVVREVLFDVYGGSVEIAIDGDVIEFDTDDDLDESDTALRLRGLLHSKQWTMDMLKVAHQKLLEVRRFKPRAGALALCIDSRHALKVAEFLEEITGQRRPSFFPTMTRRRGPSTSMRRAIRCGSSRSEWSLRVSTSSA